jgi:hypothetical protein
VLCAVYEQTNLSGGWRHAAAPSFCMSTLYLDTALGVPCPLHPLPGHALMSSETVRKIGFTGSTAVGKLLMAQAAQVRGAAGYWWRTGCRR